jgi:fatty-acyl-CoA synthase
VGRIQPHANARSWTARGRTLPVGQPGELLTRGYLVMKGYWNDPERTAEAIQGGWMHTGDLATIDAEGYCRIVGPVKDMLIRGGENVYPAEVEEFLPPIPTSRRRRSSACPTRNGRGGRGLDRPAPRRARDAEAGCAWCRGKIAGYKVPRHIRFVDDMPLTATGKPQKFRMREAMMAEMGLS